MKKVTMIAAVVTALLIIGAACSKKTTTTNTSVVNQAVVNGTVSNTNQAVNTNTTSNANSSNTNATVAEAKTVLVSGFAFSPASLTVKKGAAVTWTNNDSVSHTVTGSGSLSSGTIAPGGTYRHTFDAVGTFSYSCGFHPAMLGTVTVTE